MDAVFSLHLQTLLTAASAGFAVGLMLLVVHSVFDVVANIYREVFK